jgi:ABC-type transport system involved in multi-copper enzyme maturation permease subunit
MRAYIWFEFKRKFFQPKTWFLMVLIFILSFQKVVDYNEKSLTDINSPEATFDLRGKLIENSGNRLLEDYKDGPEKSKNSAKFLTNVGTQIRIAAAEENYDEWKRLLSFGNLVRSKAAVQKFGGLREESFRIRSMKIWKEVSNGVDYGEVDFKHGDPLALRGYSDTFLADSQYNHILYKDNLYPIGRYHMDGMTFLYHYFNEIIPMLIGFIILILVFDSINEEWSNGSLKLILTQPFSRNKYLISKIIIGTLQALFIILIPAIIISMGYGIVSGFENYNYPVIHMDKGFQNFKPLPNYLERDMGIDGINQSLGISVYSNVVEPQVGFSKKLNFIPLYKFLSMALLLLIFATIFYVALNVFISSITKNKIIGFSASGLITLIGTVISQRWTIGDRYNLSPFTMNNPVMILNGTYNATALMALTVLIVSIIVIYLTNLIYFQRKDL